MKQIVLIAMAMVFALNMNTAQACNHFATVGSPSFDPMKMQFVPVSSGWSSGLTEQQFHAVLQKVQNVYDPIFQEQGAVLEFPASNWGQSAVNGTVQRVGNVWQVMTYGGYARHPLATEDALLFLACHEIGHHLGETHYYSGSYSWAAGEGQVSLVPFSEHFED